MSATICSCLRDGLILIVEDPDCRALYVHITTSREVTPA